MKKELTLYYISRAVLSALIGFLFMKTGWPVWTGLVLGIMTFGLFIWYAHSGYFMVDPSKPLTPLKRDARGIAIRDRALVIAVVIGVVLYAVTGLLSQTISLEADIKNLAWPMALLSYFVISQIMFARDAR